MKLKNVDANDVLIRSVKKVRKKYLVSLSSIEFDDEYTFCEDTIIKNCVFKDKVYTNEEFKKILHDDETNKMFELAINFISFQFRSKKELINRLKEKATTDEIIGEIIDRLEKLGYLNDEKYAHYLVEGYCNKQKGPNYIINTLREKGIEDNLIDNAMSDYTYSKEYDNCYNVSEKMKEKNKSYPIKKQKQLLLNKLSSMGYHQNVIYQVISEVEFIDESTLRLQKDLEKLKKKYKDLDDNLKKQKIMASLISKGYEYSVVKENI